MRGLVVFLGVAALLPLIFKRPWIGVLAWTWVALLSPHKEAYGLAVDARINLIIVLATVLAFALNSEPKKWPGGASPFLFVLFILWTTIACIMAPDPELSFGFWGDFVIKMAIHMILLLVAINSKHRLVALVWVFVISLGYHAVKTGLVTLKSGLVIQRLGSDFGPVDTMIMDRNHYALAMLMLCPLLFFLGRNARDAWMRWGCFGGILMALLSVVGSQSRGGFATMLVMLVFLWFRSKRKILLGGVLIIGAVIGVSYGPQQIRERISTILDQTAEVETPADEADLDESFCLRLAVWQIGLDMTIASPLWGHGLRSIQEEEIAGDYRSEDHICADKEKYGPRAAHNIYVEVMSDSGFVGLALFLGVMITSWLSLQMTIWRTKMDARRDGPLKWAHDLAGMLQVSLLAYAVGGVLLSMAYYDGYYVLICMSAILHRLVREAQGAEEPRRVIAPPKRGGRYRPGARKRAPV